MASATIKIFLVYGDPKRLRTAELSNWTGKAVAAPRTEFEAVLARDEAFNAGTYLLTGTDPETGKAALYIGEAESIKRRIKNHLGKDFWNQVVFFVSKDESLTKAHIRYLEGRLIELANLAGRSVLKNSQASGAKLPESDREDMEIFLEKMQQLLPALGVEALVPVSSGVRHERKALLFCELKELKATGFLTPNGITVISGSHAVLHERESTSKYPWIIALRRRLIEEGMFIQEGDRYVFTKDTEFSSPSAAAAAICGGTMNGLTAWKNIEGKSLKDMESS